MAFKRSDNSRNDRSGSPKKQFSEGRNSSGKDFSPRGRSAASSNRDTDKPRRNFGDAPAGDAKRFASSGSKPYSKRQGSFDRDRENGGERKKPYSGRPEFGDKREGRSGDRPARNFGDKPTKSFGDRPARNFGDKPAKSFGDRPARNSGDKREGNFGDRPAKSFGSAPRVKRPDFKAGGERSEKRFGDKPSFGGRKPAGGFQKRDNDRFANNDRGNRYERPQRRDDDNIEKPERVMRGRKKPAASTAEDTGLIRLNRYISNAGICSRRKADELIVAGVITVNGEVITELGHKVDPSKDLVRYNGETLKREKMVYVLLNKPKDYITTTDDPQERRTVMHLVEKASKERIYPVGRLDRNTTGLLLMTNDGDLADKLSHPKNNITKIYQAELDKSLTQGDLNKIGFGVELEDGFIKPDMVSYVSGGTKREIGIQIHSGKNRIVRRIFESLGYEVVKLDRVVYANLTKKDLPRGRWRYLDEQEIIQLKHLI